MGLDAQAYTKDKEGTHHPIQDWRKHNALDGWMQSLWRTKGGNGEWNCSEVELTASDIDQLKETVERDELPETMGFFYGGDSRECPYRKQETLEFIKEAKKLMRFNKLRKLFNREKKVFYSAWF